MRQLTQKEAERRMENGMIQTAWGGVRVIKSKYLSQRTIIVSEDIADALESMAVTDSKTHIRSKSGQEMGK